MRKAYLVLSLLLLLSLFLSACVTAPVPPPSTPSEPAAPEPTQAVPTETPATVEKEPKTLTVHLYEDMYNVDPAFYPSDADETIMTNVYQGLVSYKPGTFEIMNVLAESIEQSEDGLTVDFKLKEGVQFHGGYGELTADDVKFSYERIADPALQAVWAGDWAALDHVEVTGKYTGKIILKEPFAALWTTTMPGPSGYILSKKAGEEKGVEGLGNSPIGTGPYEFVEWKPNQYVRLQKFADYWGDEPEWDEIVHLYIPEESAVDIALETGELDFGRISPSSVERFENAEGFTVIQVPTLDWEFMPINVQHPNLQDVNVRKAIRYAVDVEGINEAVYEGRYLPLCQMITPQVLGYWKDGPCYTRDLEKAKEYMAKAGVDSLDVRLAIQNTESERAVGEIIQANLADIGINVTLDIQDDAAFIEDGFGPDAVKRRQLVYLNWINFPDPSLYTYFFTCEQIEQWNWSYWCNEEFDRLHQEGLRELDPEKRANIYIEMQKIMDADAPMVYVANITLYFVVRDGIIPSIAPHGRVLSWNFRSE